MSAADLLLSAVAGALVVISGGLYALFMAFARLRNSRCLARLSATFYVVLVGCTAVLAWLLGFSPAWYAVIAVMLAGYWIAPRAIWHLTEATHASEARE